MMQKHFIGIALIQHGFSTAHAPTSIRAMKKNAATKTAVAREFRYAKYNIRVIIGRSVYAKNTRKTALHLYAAFRTHALMAP
ncbi:MAG: hypothetical protein CMM07_20550 [Rhodopirellula sp.]|nr:hypothetical protein [Rhodopirellula sp.]